MNAKINDTRFLLSVSISSLNHTDKIWQRIFNLYSDFFGGWKNVLKWLKRGINKMQ